MTTITTPTTEELQIWTEQIRNFLETNNRQRISPALKADLAAQGARWCPKCRTVKAVTEFNKDASRVDGLRIQCRNCNNGAGAEYFAVHREERCEYFRGYQRERWADPEYREQDLEYQRERYRTNEVFRMNAQLRAGKRRTLEAGGVVEDFGAADLLAWWEQQGIPADRDYFTNEPLDPATRSIDHLWPVSEGGPHIRAALVPVTIGTNLAKYAKSPAEFRAWLRSEGIEPAERPDPTPFLIEALADRAAEQDTEELPELVQLALSTTVPERAKRTVVVQIEEEADHE